MCFNLFSPCSLAYYNAPLFVAECAKQPSWTNYIFNQWLSHLPPHSFRMNWYVKSLILKMRKPAIRALYSLFTHRIFRSK